jgi:hypothetical protein
VNKANEKVRKEQKMTMTELPAHMNRQDPAWDPVATIEDAEGIQKRFQESFNQFLDQKKFEAVQAVLKEELPLLAEDDNFVKKTIERLGNDIVKEKRFVFLSLNPKFKK